jgi:hypothetical protein
MDPTDWQFEKLDVITADIVGPFEVKTFNHGKYLLTIRDLATGYSEEKVMASKDLAGQLLIDTINRWETQLKLKVKIVRTDNEIMGVNLSATTFLGFLPQKESRPSRPSHTIIIRTVLLRDSIALWRKWGAPS